MRNHLSEILILNDIQITNDYMSRWVVFKRRVGKTVMAFQAIDALLTEGISPYNIL
jgi:hypothetical protein